MCLEKCIVAVNFTVFICLQRKKHSLICGITMVEFVQFHVHFQMVVLLEHNNFFAFVEVKTKKSKVIYLLLKHDS